MEHITGFVILGGFSIVFSACIISSFYLGFEFCRKKAKPVETSGWTEYEDKEDDGKYKVFVPGQDEDE